MPEPITQKMLMELVRIGRLDEAILVGRPGGFELLVRYGSFERTLCGARGAARTFAALNTAAGFLRTLGLQKFSVDTSGFEPGRLRKPRPDRATALKKTKTRPTQLSLLQGGQ